MLNIYELSRKWFDFCFDNPEKIKPEHTAIFFFAIEHCNRLGWKQKFGFPSQMTMEALGIKKHQTYSKYFKDICSWKFFILIQESKNQYSSNIISLCSAKTENDTTLDKAIIKHTAKQTESMGQSKVHIDIPIYQDTNLPIDNTITPFSVFWDMYDVKFDKKKAESKWNKLAEITRSEILAAIPIYLKMHPDKKFRKYPSTFLNNESWNDVIDHKQNLFTHPKTDFKIVDDTIYVKGCPIPLKNGKVPSSVKQMFEFDVLSHIPNEYLSEEQIKTKTK